MKPHHPPHSPTTTATGVMTRLPVEDDDTQELPRITAVGPHGPTVAGTALAQALAGRPAPALAPAAPTVTGLGTLHLPPRGEAGPGDPKPGTADPRAGAQGSPLLPGADRCAPPRGEVSLPAPALPHGSGQEGVCPGPPADATVLIGTAPAITDEAPAAVDRPPVSVQGVASVLPHPASAGAKERADQSAAAQPTGPGDLLPAARDGAPPLADRSDNGLLPVAGSGGVPTAGVRTPLPPGPRPAGVPGPQSVPTSGPGRGPAEIPAGLLQRAQAVAPAGSVRPPSGPRSPAPPAAPTVRQRPAPPVDPALSERPGPALPGWIAIVLGVCALVVCGVVVWRSGVLPERVLHPLGLAPRPHRGIGAQDWPVLALGAAFAVFAFGGLGRGRVGHAWVLTLFGRYRGSVRRTGLVWVSPLLLRRRVDVRLRHWRSEPMPAVDANGVALQVVVHVVWRIKDTARAALAVEDHRTYLAEQVESAMARVLSRLPADAFHEDAPTLRNAEAVGDALTRMLCAEAEPVGVQVFSAQPTRIEYAPEVAAAMQRRRVAALDAKHRDSVLTAVVDAVDDTVQRLTSRGLVELDDYERRALVKDLTVAFYTGRAEAATR
ncbi:SPFH domain-containing protein [Streptomyces sp. NPDC006879]|uniref:SPFH domain-containing protein n=1 Tax=Streptomyces sp. NPDC006879 TaxID=3364767 RepID=UPI0036BA8C03